MKILNNPYLEIQGKKIGNDYPVYFIADIAANHDGDLMRAKDLIYKAAEAGADAAKFQHFTAETIVSDLGFKLLNGKYSHQAKWKKSVFNVYKDASVSLDWTLSLKDTCQHAGITFFTSPYSIDIVDYIDPYVPAYKIGSGDITWIEIIEYIASKQKPYIIATGAANIDDVHRAVSIASAINPSLCLMQCNTNYTGDIDNFRYINLNVLNMYKKLFPELVLGLSDHTHGFTTVLGAVSLGARMIEKHFTDDNNREGPDHSFAMNPSSWREMVKRTRELENALGSEIKKIEDNEKETSILQRRSVRAAFNLEIGTVLDFKHLSVLRPCPLDGIAPYEIHKLLGKKIKHKINAGDLIRWINIE